jgi:hypothetical protein
MSPTHNLSSKIGSERVPRQNLHQRKFSELSHLCICYAERVCTLRHLYLQSYVICIYKSVMKNVYVLCGICTSRAMSYTQIHLLWRTCMKLWHFYLQSYVICTDTSVMKNVNALCGICTSRAMTSAEIHLLWRTCMLYVSSAPSELYNLHRQIFYAERACTLWHLYLQSYIICTEKSVMPNVYHALCGICASRDMSSAQIHLLWRTCMHSVAFVPPELYHLHR